MTGPFERNDGLREIVWAGEQLLAGGQHRAVLALAIRALREHGDLPALRVLRARALLALHLVGDAERDLALALRVRPESATIHRLLCEIALRRGDLARAEAFLERALDLDPAHPRGHELAQVTQGWRAEHTARLYAVRRAA
ncbi:MAG TPA: tetratricopeptide repeat protein [Kofleriaceae bacterium]|nr:tetratricopeptide repeat protein [Kofleriaceae bacterium]